MKLTSTIAVIGLLALLVACGGGDKQMQSTPTSPVIDPSGNWAMKFTDSQGKEMQLAAMFNQVGVVVTANSITPAGNPAPFACTPFSATFTNGLVGGQLGDIFTGNIVLANLGTIAITSTLTANGEAATGTYMAMPACAGIAATGTFNGAQVPSVTGSWSGTIQPCDFDQQTGGCPVKGLSAPFTATLSQNDSTGMVTGNYQATNLTGVSNGTIGPPPGNSPPSEGFMLSGHAFQFQMIDANGSTFIVAGGLNGPLEPPSNIGLGFDRSFKGTVFDGRTTPATTYALNIGH